ncbi:hypothetical protein Tco_1219868, partial [Tanacetum coccineum]
MKEGSEGRMRNNGDDRTKENEKKDEEIEAPLKDGVNASNSTPSSDNYVNSSTNSTNSEESVKECDGTTNSKEGKQFTYARTLTKNICDGGNQLFIVPTGLNSKSEEVVLFDEELIRLLNVPLEAWSIKGISAISSRLGRPVMMDQMTSEMCKVGSGRLSTPGHEKRWKISKENVVELKRSGNKFAVLFEVENVDEGVDPFIDKRLIVDEFIKKKLQPSCIETKDWTYKMINYFKYAWEAMERNEKVLSDEDDVYENMNPALNNIIADVVLGNDNGAI